MRTLIVVLVLAFSVSGCASISNSMGVYKIQGGGVSTTTEDGSDWVELTYHGEKDDSVEDALEAWYEAADERCDDKPFKTKKGFDLMSLFASKGTGYYVDDLYVSFPDEESDQWPAVDGTLKCQRWSNFNNR